MTKVKTATGESRPILVRDPDAPSDRAIRDALWLASRHMSHTQASALTRYGDRAGELRASLEADAAVGLPPGALSDDTIHAMYRAAGVLPPVDVPALIRRDLGHTIAVARSITHPAYPPGTVHDTDPARAADAVATDGAAPLGAVRATRVLRDLARDAAVIGDAYAARRTEGDS